jgi:ribosomal protein S12 methylthiotransferase
MSTLTRTSTRHPAHGRGLLTPYLDIPFQHASPSVLRTHETPRQRGQGPGTIQELARICPDIAIRSSFVVGFPGETEADFQYLLDWLDEAQLDRVGAFRFEPVEGAQANALPDPVPAEVKEERYRVIMEMTARDQRSKARSKNRPHPARDHRRGRRAGRRRRIGATGRSQADAPEIDGHVYLRDVDSGLARPGDIIDVTIEDADEHDLFGVPV